MLEKMTRETFASLADKQFRLDSEDGSIDLRMKEAVDMGTSPGDDRRQPFTVTFEGPADPVLPQSIYTLANEELGTLEIFLVPVASDSTGTDYEAVFT